MLFVVAVSLLPQQDSEAAPAAAIPVAVTAARCAQFTAERVPWPDPSTRLLDATWRSQGWKLSAPMGPPLQLPEHCELSGVMQERVGSDGQHYAVRFRMRLPARWRSGSIRWPVPATAGPLWSRSQRPPRRSFETTTGTLLCAPVFSAVPREARREWLLRSGHRRCLMASSPLHPVSRCPGPPSQKRGIRKRSARSSSTRAARVLILSSSGSIEDAANFRCE
jgi:hypothetical protein